jgi:ribosomal protein S21
VVAARKPEAIHPPAPSEGYRSRISDSRGPDARGVTTAGGLLVQVRRRRYFETPQDIKKRKEADKHARKRSERRQAAARARNTQ